MTRETDGLPVFERVETPAAYPYDARVALLCAWASEDGFWRWSWGFEPDRYDDYWSPRVGGMAANERLAREQCRASYTNRDLRRWTAPAWAMAGERGAR